MDVIEEYNKFKSKSFNVIRQLSRPSNIGKIEDLRKLLPTTDPIFTRFREIFDEKSFSVNDARIVVLHQKFTDFRNSRVDSIEKLYTRSYSQLRGSMSNLLDKIENLRVNYTKTEASANATLQALLSEQRTRFQNMLSNKLNEHKKEIDILRDRVNQAHASSDEKIRFETNRIIDHFEKQLESKKEAIEMTKAASDKAVSEISEANILRGQEISGIQRENNEILMKYQESINKKLSVYEKDVEDFQSEYDTLVHSLMSLEQELEKKWNDIQEKHQHNFTVEDGKYEIELAQYNEMIPNMEEKVKELEVEAANLREQKENIIEVTRQDLEKEMTELVERQKKEVKDTEDETIKDYDREIKEKEENLRQIIDLIKNDESDFQAKAEEKRRQHQDKVNAMISSFEEQVKQKNDLIKQINEDIIRAQNDWKAERHEINTQHDKDMNDLKEKVDWDNKYYKAKLELLSKELGIIVDENTLILENEMEEDVENVDEDSQTFINEMKAKMEVEISARVQERMSIIKKQHSEELNDLMSMIQAQLDLESDSNTNHDENSNDDLTIESQSSYIKQSSLSNEVNSVEDDTPSQSCVCDDKVESEKDYSASPIKGEFFSDAYMEAQLDKWRANYFMDRKNLKKEEAEALLNLDIEFDRYKETIDKVKSLQNQLSAAHESYKETIEKLASEQDVDLNSLKTEIEEKEKTMATLERKFRDTEREVVKRSKGIQEAEYRLNKLKKKLNEEKEKIHATIRGEYTPLINEEKDKAERILSELDTLRMEFEASTKCLKNDLFDIETSNAAMEEDIKNETKVLIENLQIQMVSEIVKIEDKFTQEITDKEKLRLDDIRRQRDEIDRITEEKIHKIEQEILDDQENYSKKTNEISDKCAKIAEINTSKRQQIEYLINKSCELCPVLERNIRKLEKLLIEMQYQDRGLVLDERNKNDTIQTFKPKTKLPPLPTINHAFI